MSEGDQRPAVNEKLAASLILLRVALLLGLSTERTVPGGAGGLEIAETSALPDCSGGSDVPSAAAATSGSSLTEITHTQKYRLSLHLMKGRKGANKSVMHSLKCVFVLLRFA